MPALVAGVVPWWLHRAPERWPITLAAVQWIGPTLFLPAFLLFTWTVRDFFVRGQGTLAPWDPPKFLVAQGAYRWCRNPMYVGVLGMIWGQGLWWQSGEVVVYGYLLAATFHLRVVFGEEPWLARSFPEPWAGYRAKVRRWGVF